MADSRLISFHIPSDAILTALGKIAVQHSHLEHILKMTIKSLTGLSVHEALHQNHRKSSQALRKKIETTAKERLGDAPERTEIQKFLERSWQASDKRNDYIHGVWAKELDGDEVFSIDGHTWQPCPTASDLENLFKELSSITAELNTSRLEGTISEALKQIETAH